VQFQRFASRLRRGKRFAVLEGRRHRMLACNRLRIDRDDGSAALDYRIENGRVESRTLEMPTEGHSATGREWQRLTPEQLTSHIMSNTVVAQWLRRRMGVYRLVRACNQALPSGSVKQDWSTKIAA
jgi:hypothetical protein